MIAAELRGGNKPNLSDALGWIGSRVDDIYGAAVGRLEDVWIDPGTGTPRWLLVKEGRFNGRTTLIPFEDATAGAGHVWIPYEREAIRAAPEIEPGAPLTQQVESELRDHFRAHAPAAVSHRGHTEPGGPAPTPLQPPAPPAEEMGPRLGAARATAEPPPTGKPAPAPGPAPTPYRSYSEISERLDKPAPERRTPPAPEPIPFGRSAAPEPEPEPGPPPLRAAEPPPPPAAPDPGWGEGAPRPILRPAPAPRQQPPVETREPLPHAPPAAAIHRPAPAASAPEHEAPASLPVAHGLEGPYRIELELEGGLRISGELRSLRILPTDEQ